MESTPIINLFRHDPDTLDRYRKWMLCPLPSLTDPDSDPPTVRRTGESSVQYAKRLLGKQDYCKTYLCKCWVWEDVAQGWRLYASRRGLQLEVLLPDGFDWADEGNLSRATAAFDAFLTRWGKMMWARKIDLFSYRVKSPHSDRVVKGQYAPHYGYVSNDTTTNGSWFALYNALYELDPAYMQLPDQASMGLTVTPVSVPAEMLQAAKGFMDLPNLERYQRIMTVRAVLEKLIAQAQQEHAAAWPHAWRKETDDDK